MNILGGKKSAFQLTTTSKFYWNPNFYSWVLGVVVNQRYHRQQNTLSFETSHPCRKINQRLEPIKTKICMDIHWRSPKTLLIRSITICEPQSPYFLCSEFPQSHKQINLRLMYHFFNRLDFLRPEAFVYAIS